MTDLPLTHNHGAAVDRVLVSDRHLQRQLRWDMAIIAAFVVALGVLFVFSDWSQPVTWGQATAATLALGFAFWRRTQHLRWHGTYLVFGRTSLRVLRRERMVEEIPYVSISGYRLSGSRDGWLRIERNDGAPEWIAPGPPETEGAVSIVVRNLGPNLPAGAVQERGERPEDPLLAYLWEHFGNPPEVTMRRGVMYRYREPERLKQFTTPPYLMLTQALCLAVMAVGQVTRPERTPFTAVCAGIAMLGILFALYFAFRFHRFQASLNDRIELGEGEIRIHRQGRSWSVPLRERHPWLPARVLDRPIRYFGPGLDGHGIDLRFIEPEP